MSWISELSQQVSQQVAQIEKTLDTAVNVADGGASTTAAGAAQQASWEQRALAAEQRAEGLLKEGLSLAEKQGRAENALRKTRKEKDEAEAREKATTEALTAALEEKARFEEELKTLRDIKRRGEESIQQITGSNAEAMRRVDDARAAQLAAEKREQEAKAQLERAFAESSEHKKAIMVLTQERAAARKEAEVAKFQLREQLDSKQVQGSRVDSMEKTLAEVKGALEEQVREARQAEAELRVELARVSEARRVAERRADEVASESLAVTTPLLRQIDALQKLRERYDESSAALLTRAVAAEAAEAEANSARKRAEAVRAETQARLGEAEAALLTLRAEHSRAVSDLRLASKRAEEMERERDALSSSLDALRLQADSKTAEMRAVEIQLRQALANEQERGERTRKLADERARDLMAKHQADLRRSSSAIPTSPAEHTRHLAASSSTAAAADSSTTAPATPLHNRQPTQGELLAHSLGGQEDDDGADGSGLLAMHELRAGVRRRDARLAMLDEQLQAALRGREALASELALASARIKALEAQAAAGSRALKELETLQHRNAVLLELLGEREEMIDQLKADLDLLATAGSSSSAAEQTVRITS